MAETRTLPVRVKIVSDGTRAGTKVLDSRGNELDLPLERISWEVNALSEELGVTRRIYFDELLPIAADGTAKWRIVFKDGSEWVNGG